MRDKIYEQARILIIDDDAIAAEVLCRTLEAEGYRHVEWILDPRDAIEKYRRLEPDLVLLDWMMPQLSGSAVLQQLRAEIAPADFLPILVVTALPNIETKQEALGSGATDFLHKPYDPSEIVLRVANLLLARFLHLELTEQNELLERRVQQRTAELWDANAALKAESAERARVQRAVERITEEWKQSFDAIPDHVCILDLEGRILRANRTMREQFEPIHGNLEGLDYRLCYCGSASSEMHPPCVEVLAKNRPVAWEGEVPGLDGWFSIAGYPLSESGVQWGAISVVRDLTARKQAEEALREAQEELEERVRSRTEELRRANEALSNAAAVQTVVQHALEKSESRLRAVFDENPLMLVTVDAAGLIRSISRFGAEQLGYAPEELIGKPQSLLYHHDDQQAAADHLAHCLACSALNQPIEVRKVRKNGNVLWARETARAFGSNGSELALVVCEDITERKRMREALRASQERSRAIFDQAPAGFCQITFEGQFERVNPKLCELFQYSSDELLKLNVADITHPDDLPRSLELIGEIAAGRRESFAIDKRYLRRDGSVMGAFSTVSVLRDLEGRPESLIAVVEDMSARQEAEQRLRFQAHMLDNVGEAVIATDPAGLIVYANDCAETLYGWRKEELIGQSVVDMIAPQPNRQQAAVIVEKLRNGETWSGEFPVQRRDGTTFDAFVINSPLVDERGELIAIVGISKDITERKRAETALRESEERLREFLDHAPWAVYMKDTTGRYLLVNRQCEQVLHVSAADAIGRKDSDLASLSGAAENFAAQDREVLASGQVKYFEDRLSLADGIHIFSSVKFPMRDAGGEPYAVCGISIDVTEQKRTQEQLNRFFTLSLDLLTTVGFDGYLKELNPSWEAMLGWSVDELKSRPLYEFVHPDDLEKTRTEAERIVSELKTTSFENRYRCKDGSYKLLSWQARADVESQLIYATARVITGTRQIETALRESEERFRSIADDVLDKAALGIIILDSSFHIAWANETIGVFFGAPRADLLGAAKPRSLFDWLKNIFAEPEVFASKVLATYENNTYVERLEAHVLPAEGREERWLQHWSQPIETGLYAGGRIEFYTDISELKRAEQAVHLAMAEAERANRAKSEFLSRMSHELRTPLNAIVGFAQLAELDAETPDERENVEQIQAAGAHLLQLVNEILDLASIEAGRMALSVRVVPLHVALHAALALVRPMAAVRKVELIEAGCHQYVVADEQRLQQVLLNLLSNAIKYNKEGGSVRVTCDRTAHDFVRLEVHDTGVGIDAFDLSGLFQPFQRLHNSDASTQGIGLGLAISRRLMDAMGGSIAAESTRGVGSVFWIELPAADGIPDTDDVPPTRAASPPARAAGAELTLLYIEDNPSNAKLVERVLAHRSNARMITAPDGRTGLEMARQHRPVLILLDLDLPDMRGDQVLTWLKSDPLTADVPVVILTADATRAEAARLSELGAVAYLTKPFQVPHLLETIDSALGGKLPKTPAP